MNEALSTASLHENNQDKQTARVIPLTPPAENRRKQRKVFDIKKGDAPDLPPAPHFTYAVFRPRKHDTF